MFTDAVISASFTLAGMSSPAAAQEPDGWWVLRSLRHGAMVHHFVLVEGPSARLYEVYEDAGRSLCHSHSHCMVHFWDDPDRAAAGLPLTDSQAEAKAASYTRNTQTGHEQLLVSCRIRNDPDLCFE